MAIGNGASVTGRVAVLKDAGQGFELQEYEVPEPEPGAMVIKVSMAGVCGSDLHAWRGDIEDSAPWGAVQSIGVTQGHEMVGSVYRLGKGVTSDALGRPLREGDRICHMLSLGCFHCHACARGLYNLCQNLRGLFRPAGEWPYFTGTFSDYYYLPPVHFVYRVPDELPDSLVASVNCAMSAVMQGLTTVGVLEGEAVVIQGAGGLGLSATAIAKDMGAYPIIVMDRLEPRLELAAEFGADYTINVQETASADERVERVRELTEGVGANVVVELVGLAELLPEGVDMLRAGGTFLEIGNMVWGKTVPFDPSSMLSGKRIIGSAGSQPWVIPKVLQFLVKNRERFPFEKLASHTFPLDKINEAFAEAEWAGRHTNVVRAYLTP